LGAGFGFPDRGRGDLAVPRAAVARKDDAVLHSDRGDDLLSRAFAPVGACGRARCRRFRLAVHRAGAGKRHPARDRGDDRLYTDWVDSWRRVASYGRVGVSLWLV